MAEVEKLVAELTLEEKATLMAGGGFFNTAPIERLGIPQVNVTDGPSGARGLAFPGLGGSASTCIPCGSALGATWDPALVERLGDLLGREALDRGCRGLLAPTVNLHRSPLAGRNFECYSEDPVLSGRIATGYVRGVQSQGVFATVKHFVGNDAETERMSMSSVIDERALRELYLVPFEMAVRDGGAMGIMSSYNRVNGHWVTEQRELLVDLLRDEWGFEGLVMTDWFAVADTTVSPGAGLDLEMPGPGRSYGQAIVDAVAAGTLDEGDVDDAVRRLLSAFDRMGILDEATPDDAPKDTTPEDTALIRSAAADAMVLLQNDGVLPLDASALRRVAVIGAHAVSPVVVGGGSAGVVLHPITSPLDALTSALGDGVDVVYRRGAEVSLAGAVIGGPVLRAPDGFDVDIYEGTDFAGDVVEREHCDRLRFVVFSSVGGRGGVTEGEFSARIRGTIVPEESGTFQLALSQAGRARVLLDGRLVLDGFTDPPPAGGSDFFGMASKEATTEVDLGQGVPVEVVVEYARLETRLAGVRVGFRTVATDALLTDAVSVARDADAVLLFLGRTDEWETEGRDQPGFGLPGRQAELAAQVIAANPRTVVVLNAGSAVDLASVDGAAAVLQTWFGGQEIGNALADVVTGVAEPGGRLPMTVAERLGHYPSHGSFPGENGEVRYGEGVFMGYRGFDHREIEPRYAFGHGLGYTTFELGAPSLSSPTFAAGDRLTVSVPVRNTGTRAGAEVVQCYIAPLATRLARPPKELKAFAKVRLEAGTGAVVELELDDRSFAYWDPGQADVDEITRRVQLGGGDWSLAERRTPGWQVDPGQYRILIGRSAADIQAEVTVEVAAPRTH